MVDETYSLFLHIPQDLSFVRHTLPRRNSPSSQGKNISSTFSEFISSLSELPEVSVEWKTLLHIWASICWPGRKVNTRSPRDALHATKRSNCIMLD